MSSLNKNNTFLNKQDNKQEVVSITYEEIGLFPRSFSRVLDRFLKQVFSDVENLVIQEYRFYRYLFLTTLKCLLILFFVPFLVNFLAKTYVVRPLTEYFWNTKQTEIFLNSYQQKRAFAELKEFEEKTYFESLIFPKSSFTPNLSTRSYSEENIDHSLGLTKSPNLLTFETSQINPAVNIEGTKKTIPSEGLSESQSKKSNEVLALSDNIHSLPLNYPKAIDSISTAKNQKDVQNTQVLGNFMFSKDSINEPLPLSPDKEKSLADNFSVYPNDSGNFFESNENRSLSLNLLTIGKEISETNNQLKNKDEYKQTDFLMNSYTMKSSLFLYQTQEADKNIQQRYQEKTLELAQRYNDQSIEAITNFFADLISLFSLFYLLYVLEIQINITKSFLLEVFFGLDDSKKSLLILLITDLLVGYHSSNLWELFFEFLFHHYGLPESQTGIFLLVATLPVLLDVLFKYLIFRHLNRSSPATVATYHAMIE